MASKNEVLTNPILKDRRTKIEYHRCQINQNKYFTEPFSAKGMQRKKTNAKIKKILDPYFLSGYFLVAYPLVKKIVSATHSKIIHFFNMYKYK